MTTACRLELSRSSHRLQLSGLAPLRTAHAIPRATAYRTWIIRGCQARIVALVDSCNRSRMACRRRAHFVAPHAELNANLPGAYVK